ncbi:hypothetical protein JG687_00018507 [Phytophthora cactorum]|uniref:Uncharacterized protein n=1 Tax=Phytophthora cactorum TaxID=29920 RepID=A0A8T1TKI3_9STRA|nr:hypothetical protein JG687_00018507 [Phytophthora cactorum]
MAFFNQVTKAALALLTLPFLTAQAIFSTCEITDSDACGIDSLTASIDHGSVLIKVVMTRAAPSTIDKYTCDFALQCQLDPSSLITTEASLTDTGIMNHSLDSNVFNAYNIVYLSGAAR